MLSFTMPTFGQNLRRNCPQMLHPQSLSRHYHKFHRHHHNHHHHCHPSHHHHHYVMIFLRCSGAAVASSCAQSNSLASTAGSHQHCHHYYFEKQTFVIICSENLLTKVIKLSQGKLSSMSEHRKFQIYFFVVDLITS